MSIIIYGGTERQVKQQLSCNHNWHGPCIDKISRYCKCKLCFCFERDCVDEEEYYRLVREVDERKL